MTSGHRKRNDMYHTDYELMLLQMKSLMEDVEYDITNLANASALIYESMKGLNWAGFYLYRNDELVLGPFQGKTACTRIPMGKGVCGTAALSGQIQVVPDVHQFPGHIACDSASNSEIVLPIIVNGGLIGVMDIDSPEFNRFTPEDAEGLASLCNVLASQVCWDGGLL